MLLESSLRRSALLLGAAGAIEFMLQMVMPVLLVRHLDPTTFGQYRLLWLLANTATSIAPAFMPMALFYFLPRAKGHERGAVIGNVLLYCALAGSVTGMIASSWNPWMQEAVRALFAQTRAISSCFLLLWIVATVTDVLPTADGRAGWQAYMVIAVALLRTVLLAAAALTAPDIVVLATVLAVVAGTKIVLLFHYLFKNDDLTRMRFEWPRMKQLLAYALPFAVGNTLFLMRSQGDQWIVISLTTPALFATFSIATVVQPVTTLLRQPVINAMMPRLNAAHARGDTGEIVGLIARCNGAAGMLLIPIVGALAAVAPALVQVLYTSRYAAAAPVMQVYLIGMVMNVFAVGHVLSALGQGAFSVRSSLYCLVFSLVLSWAGLHYFGLPGAALGSVASLGVNELWSLHHIAAGLRVPMRRLVSWRPLWSTLCGTSVAVAGTLLAGHRSAQQGLTLLVTESVLYAVLFLLFFLASGGRRQCELVLGWRRLAQAAVAPP